MGTLDASHLWKMKVLVADCSRPGPSVLEIFQVRILEWVDYSRLEGIFPT